MVFEPEGGYWTVRDLASKNGTFVNGSKIEGRQYLRAGDRILAGGLTIVYSDKERGEQQQVIFEAPPAPNPQLHATSVSLKDILATKHQVSPASPDAADASQLGTVWAFIRGGRELASPRPLPELFRTILDLSLEAVGAERGVLLTLDEGDRLGVQASSGGELRISTTVRDRVLKERASILVQDVQHDQLLQASEVIVRQGVRSLMAVPLQTDERVIGLIYVDSLRPQRAFTSDELNLLTVMANVAGIRIEREQWEQQRRTLIEENVTTLDRLAAVLSHELNSPLGALKSTIDTLTRVSEKKDSASPGEQPRMAALEADLRGTLDASINRMNQVISRIQRFTNLDRAEVQSVNLNELLNDVIALADTRSDEGNVAIEISSEALPPVICRPRHLNMVFSNLLNNALEACRRNSGRPGRIRISTSVRDPMIEIQLEDNGAGMSSEELAHVFEPGFQVHHGRVMTGNWSLFSSRQIVRQQGGDIRLSSEPKKGTTVVVSLPPQPAGQSIG
jgi:signal transduction histidine kinase